MKTIQVNAYEYQELNQDAKFKVKLWLDEIPTNKMKWNKSFYQSIKNKIDQEKKLKEAA